MGKFLPISLQRNFTPNTLSVPAVVSRDHISGERQKRHVTTRTDPDRPERLCPNHNMQTTPRSPETRWPENAAYMPLIYLFSQG